MADEFKVKVTADLDTSQLEAKLNALQNKKINVQVNLNNINGNGISNLNNSLQQVQNNANGVSASLKGIATTKIKVDALNFLKTQTENAVQSVTDLNKAMQGLRDEYASLIEEIREIKEETKKVYCGSGIRYKIARWLIK